MKQTSTILAILLLILILSGCAVSKPETKLFTVKEVHEKTFIAESGKLRAVFFKIDCDTNIYVGKIITVSRANKIR